MSLAVIGYRLLTSSIFCKYVLSLLVLGSMNSRVTAHLPASAAYHGITLRTISGAQYAAPKRGFIREIERQRMINKCKMRIHDYAL